MKDKEAIITLGSLYNFALTIKVSKYWRTIFNLCKCIEVVDTLKWNLISTLYLKWNVFLLCQINILLNFWAIASYFDTNSMSLYSCLAQKSCKTWEAEKRQSMGFTRYIDKETIWNEKSKVKGFSTLLQNSLNRTFPWNLNDI